MDSLISINISGSILKSSSSISFARDVSERFSIKLAVSDGCKSFKV